MSPEETHLERDRGSIFDGDGETALLEAKRLVRAGELAARANQDDDFEAFGSVFRAIGGRLELVELLVESGRQEVLALRTSLARESAVDRSDLAGS